MINTLNELFSFENVYNCAKSCLKGVRWKTSTQNFELTLMLNVEDIRQQVLNKTYKSKGFHEFKIRERGKLRNIMSVHITERMVQKCLCEYYLLPKLTPTLIYDNGACLRGKGTHFATKRLKHHIHNYWLNHKTNKGYILQFDIKSFFNSINHQILLNIAKKYLNEDIYELYAYFVNCFPGDIGLGLGSQISQISASMYLNKLDHLIKDELRFKYYGRYMDDGYIICGSKERLKECLQKIIELFDKLQLKLNSNKTQIIALKDFTFMKRRYILYENGKIVIKPYKKNILRYKRKVKKLITKDLDKKDIDVLTQTFVGYLKEFNYYDRYTRRVLNVYTKKGCRKSRRQKGERRNSSTRQNSFLLQICINTGMVIGIKTVMEHMLIFKVEFQTIELKLI